MAMTDGELRDAAVAHLKKTTVGYINKRWTTPPAGSEWKQALDLLAQVGITPPPDPDPVPPQPTTAYFVEDWSTGRFESNHWDLLFSCTNPGYFSTPIAQTPDGRVAVVNDPVRAGRKCARVEVRDSDPGWPSSTNVDKSEIDMGNSTRTWNGSFSFGAIRWFDIEMLFPYNATEKFEWATGSFCALWGLHPPGGSPAMWSANHIEWNPYQFNTGNVYAGYKNVQLNFHSEGGAWAQSGSNPNDRNWGILPMTDGNGNRVMASHNRWVRVVFGIKFNPDNSGWLEVWCDKTTPGTMENVIPRVNRPTCWDVDAQYSSSYFKYGIYYTHANSFPESGRSVMYYGRTTIGNDKPF